MAKKGFVFFDIFGKKQCKYVENRIGMKA